MDLLKSLREDHRAFAASLSRLQTLTPREARELLGGLEPRFRRHEALESKFLFPELRGLETGLDAAVLRDETGNAELERELGECRRLAAERAAADDLVDEIEAESFPASDPPSWTLGRAPKDGELRRELRRLSALLRRHLRLEDRVIYPAAETDLSAACRAQISERAYEDEYRGFIDKGGGD